MEGGWIVELCATNNLPLNIRKTKELVVDFRTNNTEIALLFIKGECMERVLVYNFLRQMLQEH